MVPIHGEQGQLDQGVAFGGGWKLCGCCCGGVGEGTCPIHGVFQGTPLAHDVDSPFEAPFGLIFGFDAADPEAAFLLGTVMEGVDQGQGDFAFLEVVADAFAQGFAGGGVVQGVVHDLVGLPQEQAVVGQTVFFFAGPVVEDAADAGGGGEEGCGFSGDDLHVLVFVGSEVVADEQLHDLAFGDDGAGVGDDFEYPDIPVIDQHLEGAGEEKITDQDGGFAAPDGVGGLSPAAGEGFVDDIVVEEGGCVDELDDGGEGVVLPTAVAEHAGCEQGQDGAQPLAAAVDQVGTEFGDQWDLGVEFFEDDAIGLFQIGTDDGMKVPEHRLILAANLSILVLAGIRSLGLDVGFHLMMQSVERFSSSWLGLKAACQDISTPGSESGD